MAGQTRINGNLIDTGTDPEDIVSISTGDARYPKLDGPNTLSGDLTVDNGTLFVDSANNRVGVGTSSPSENLHVNSGGNDVSLRVSGGGYTNAKSSTLTLTGGRGDNGRIKEYIIRSQATGGGGNVQNNLEFRRNIRNVGERLVARMSSAGDISFYEDTGTTPKFFWDASAERLGIGTSSPNSPLHVNADTENSSVARFEGFNPNRGLEISTGADGAANDVFVHYNQMLSGYGGHKFDVGDSTVMTVDHSGNVGIGTSSPSVPLEIRGPINSVDGQKIYLIEDSTPRGAYFKYDADPNRGEIGGLNSTENKVIDFDRDGNQLVFYTSDSEAARIDSSGNLLVGTTSTFPPSDSGNEGVAIRTDSVAISRNTSAGLFVDRMGNQGDIAQFRRDNNTVGAIANDGLTSVYGNGACGIKFASGHWRPTDGDGSVGVSGTDNVTDIGRSQNRFDNIYATNGTIQTSDVNEKQDVEELTDAEARAAAKAKTLLRKYRWKSAVEEKGDEARIHFGIIAQDLEQAFIDEGLDAGRYGMFIRGEWYEAEVEKTRTVENDDGTETTETYMATETYDSAEEAPADAVHKERLGVRYHELLAFIIAAI